MPIDLGGFIVSGIMARALVRLRRHLGFEGDVKVCDVFQMLGEVMIDLEALCAIFTTHGPASLEKPFTTPWHYLAVPGVSRYQRFWVDGGFDAVLGTYVEYGRAALAVERFPAWTSIYVGAPNGLAGEMMNNVLVFHRVGSGS